MLTKELSQLTEEELRAFLTSIQDELATRDRRKKAEATRQIKEMAEAAGLCVAVKEKGAKRRGRPPKAEMARTSRKGARQ